MIESSWYTYDYPDIRKLSSLNIENIVPRGEYRTFPRCHVEVYVLEDNIHRLECKTTFDKDSRSTVSKPDLRFYVGAICELA